MTALEDVFLAEMQRLVVGYKNLLFHQVHAHHFFRDGMLHLQTRIHFEEVEVPVLVHQKFNGTRTRIVYGLGGGNRLLSHLLAQLWRQERRRAFFHNLLVAALHRTLAVEQMNHIAVVITQNLELYVMRFFHKLLQIHRVVAE